MGRSLRDVARYQDLMRREMEAGLHKPLAEPVKLGEALDDLFGMHHETEDKEVQLEAQAIINAEQGNIQLNLQQWAVIQRMVEAGIVSGRMSR